MSGLASVLTSLVFGYTCRAVQVVDKGPRRIDVANRCDIAFSGRYWVIRLVFAFWKLR